MYISEPIIFANREIHDSSSAEHRADCGRERDDQQRECVGSVRARFMIKSYKFKTFTLFIK
jgi:hypothetical protein